MQEISNIKRISIFVFAITAILSINFYLNSIRPKVIQYGEVLGDVTTTVDVTVGSYGCIVDLNIVPAETPSGNWDEDLVVQIFDEDDIFIGEFNMQTDNTGSSTKNICAEDIYLTSGTYDIYVRGKSHLNKAYFEVEGFSNTTTTFEFTDSDQQLIPGEVSKTYNNYINSLDISSQISKMETSDDVTDLNNDGEVNNLDVSITLNNFYTKGDCSPKEIEDEVCTN